MLNSDRLTERAFLPVEIVSSPCMVPSQRFPPILFPQRPSARVRLYPAFPQTVQHVTGIGRFKDMDVYDSSSDGITARSQYSGSANRERLRQNSRKLSSELASYFLRLLPNLRPAPLGSGCDLRSPGSG